MLIVDTLKLDPASFLPNGAELDLSDAGFRVLEADFGDADVEVQLQRQALGEIPTDYHPPNTVTTLKLGVRKEGEVDLPTAAYKLAQKVGEINQPGTEHWIERVFDYKAQGEFAGPLGKRVYKATLQGLGGWQRGESPDVTLTLITGSCWYSTEEDESEVVESGEGDRHLIQTLDLVNGSTSGLLRYRVKNQNESGDLRGVILAGSSRDLAQDETADTTAADAYDCADLTPKGGAEVKEIKGVKYVEHASLTAGWLSILNSKIDASELHMTHLGVRRVWIRAAYPEGGEEKGNVQLKLRWRALGSVQWSENSIVPMNVNSDWQLYDLGEARPEAAALGDQRWEWELQARAASGSGKVLLHLVYPFPTEQFALVKAPGSSQAAEAQKQKLPGTVEDNAEVGEIAWTNPSNAKTSNDTYATVDFIVEPGEHSHYLLAKDFSFAIPEGATITGVAAEIERKANATAALTDYVVALVKAGAVVDFVTGGNRALVGFWPTSDSVAIYGGSSDLFGTTLTPTEVNDEGFGIALSVRAQSAAAASVDAITLIVYYSEAGSEGEVCFATRSIELRSDGIARQHPTDDVWGALIPEGFLPYASPSGLEERKSRYIVVPTQGDLGELADSGDNSLSAQAFVRPGYLVARESA